MKKIILFLLLPPCLMAQNKEARKFYGTFIENQKVFNYEFIHNPGAGHTFKVMPVSQPVVSISESLKKLEDSGKKEELNSLVEELEALNASADEYKTAIENIETLLKSKVSENTNEVTLLQAIEKYARIDTLLQKTGKDFEVILDKTVPTETRISKILSFISAQHIKELDEITALVDSLTKVNVSLSTENAGDTLNAQLKKLGIEKKKLAINSLLVKNRLSLTKLREVYNELSQHILTMSGILGIKESLATPFYELDKEIFKGILEKHLESIDINYLNTLRETKVNDKTQLEELATRLFYTLQTRLSFEDEKPIAGVLMLISDKVLVNPNRIENSIKKGIYRVKEVSLEFEDGVIKNIEAIIYREDNTAKLNNYFRFRNLKPIGITGKFHPDKLQNFSLFCRISKADFLTVKLSDLIAYYPVLRSYSENYAPENSVVTLIPSVGQTVIELEKEKTSEILDVQIFSDLAGLRVGNPQGLIQAGIFRKITVNTRHKQCSKWYTNHGWLNYVTPEFFITKIDQKEPYYPYENSKKLESIKLYQYQFIKFGAEIGLFKFNIPNAQLNFQFLGSIHWVGSNIIDKKIYDEANDSLNVTGDASRLFSNIYRGGLMVETKPESRWGASLKYVIPVRYAILNKELGLTRGDIYNSKGFATLTFNGFLKTSPSNKFFFRWSYNRLDKGTFFHQMQLGVQSSLQRYVEDRK